MFCCSQSIQLCCFRLLTGFVFSPVCARLRHVDRLSPFPTGSAYTVGWRIREYAVNSSSHYYHRTHTLWSISLSSRFVSTGGATLVPSLPTCSACGSLISLYWRIYCKIELIQHNLTPTIILFNLSITVYLIHICIFAASCSLVPPTVLCLALFWWTFQNPPPRHVWLTFGRCDNIAQAADWFLDLDLCSNSMWAF